MKYGFVFPGNDVHEAVAFGIAAEQAGWDGFFVWDSVWGVDPWVTLAAVAVQTKRIRLGTMLTPVSRRRPWKLAGETSTLDQISGGRVILAAGLGAPDTGFEAFGEETDRKIRAELMDEGLAIIEGLWRGQPFNFSGKHYQVKETTFHPAPPPVQQPRIPVWMVGGWPREKSMRRVLAWDGLLPNKMEADGSHGKASPDDLRAMKAFIDERRTRDTPFDIVMEGVTPGDPARAAEQIRPYAEAGATWWLEAIWTSPSLDPVRERLLQGPPAQP
ncbi:MAG TPA: LLM class flavin-dependent oxidoreductase [Kouleothrix sp.]|uniref:LLM class flavin-dependent oxidoreductase n=1 Tax=Kouleothrix sp. TaxID=2779161 RepID=UPI002BE23270|nr:LLM class flavin-dependent oxidoreductase [Kouleothrix sp.]